MFKVVFPNSVLTNYTTVTGSSSPGTLQGASMKVSNLSNRGVSIQTRGTNITVYYVEAYRFAIIPNGDYTLVLDSGTMMDYLHPSAQVTVTTIDDKLPYQEGELLAATAPLEVLNITGTVQLSTGQQVSISGPVQLQAGQSVNATIQNATLDSNIINDYVSTNPLILFASATSTITNLSNGSTFYGAIDGNFGLYDGFIVVLYSEQSKQYTLVTQNSGAVIVNSYGISTGGNYAYPTANSTIQQPAWLNGFGEAIVSLDRAVGCNQFAFGYTNNTGSAIVSDVVHIQVWAIQATTTVNNKSSSPIPTQGQYISATTALGNLTASGTSIAPNAVGATAPWTPAINVINAKRISVFGNLTASSGLGTVGTNGGLLARLKFYGSMDGSTFYAIGGNSAYPNNFSWDSNSPAASCFDESTAPQLVAGYNYIAFVFQIYNQGGGNYTGSATVGLTVVTQQ